MVIKMAKEAFGALIAELTDKRKVTHMYLDEFGEPFDPDRPHETGFAWKYVPEDHKKLTLGMWATSDVVEANLGKTTAQIETFHNVSIAGAAGVSDAKANLIFQRPTKRNIEKAAQVKKAKKANRTPKIGAKNKMKNLIKKGKTGVSKLLSIVHCIDLTVC